MIENRKKVLSKEQLEIEYLKLKVEWLEENQVLYMRGKDLYSFSQYMERFYKDPGSEMEDILIRLFYEGYLDDIYFGHWCMMCGSPISTNESDYCDSCLVTFKGEEQ